MFALPDWTLRHILQAARELLPREVAASWARAVRTVIDATPFHPDFSASEVLMRSITGAASTTPRCPPDAVDTVYLFLYAPTCPNCARVKADMATRAHHLLAVRNHARDGRVQIGQVNMKDERNDILHLLWSVTHVPRVLRMDRDGWSVLTWEKVVAQWTEQERVESIGSCATLRAGLTCDTNGVFPTSTIRGQLDGAPKCTVWLASADSR